MFFEFIDKLGVDYYCFHDRDVAPELADFAKSNEALDAVVDHLGKPAEGNRHQAALGHRLPLRPPPLHPGCRHQSPNADVFAYAAAQVKKAMDVTHELGGEGYTFWGGREGYATLLNTDMKRELDHLAALPAHGRRLQEEDRLQGPVLHRAEAEGAVHAPVRLRLPPPA